MRTLFIAMLAGALTCPGITMAGPFGLEPGMSKEQLGVTTSEDMITSVPHPSSLFTRYEGVFGLKTGLCGVGVGTDVFEEDPMGTQAKAVFDKVRGALDNIYGESEFSEVALPGSIWSAPEDFAMSLAKGHRVYMATWNKDAKAPPISDVTTITLLVRSFGSSSTQVIASYHFSNRASCDAENDAAAVAPL